MTDRQHQALETAKALLTNHPTDLESVGRARELVEEVLTIQAEADRGKTFS